MHNPLHKHVLQPHHSLPKPHLSKSSLFLLSRFRTDFLSSEFEDPSWNGVSAREMCLQILNDVGIIDSIGERIAEEVLRQADTVQDVGRGIGGGKIPDVQVEVIDLDEIESHGSNVDSDDRQHGGQDVDVVTGLNTGAEDEDMPDLDELLKTAPIMTTITTTTTDKGQEERRSQYFSGVAAGQTFSASSAIDAFLALRGEKTKN